MKTKEKPPKAHDPAACEATKPCADCVKVEEANAASTLAATARKGAKPGLESARIALAIGVRFLESIGGPNDDTREVPVLIIKEGMGNAVDRHFYSRELLAKIAPMFDGVKAYADHPTKTQEKDQPERSVRQIVGYYHSPRVVLVEGKSAIAATLKIIEGDSYAWAWNLVKEAAAFAKKFPTKDLVGISINAWGASHQVEAENLGLVNMVDDLTEVQSADIVTAAGAGGGFRLREAVQSLLGSIKEVGPMDKEAFARFGDGLKALSGEMSKNPEHAKAYGPAMEALMGAHADIMKTCEGGPAAAALDSADADGVEEKKKKAAEAAAQAAKENTMDAVETLEQMRERYVGGKMTPAEKNIFEKLNEAEVREKVRANKEMIEAKITEAKIPEAFADDLRVTCVGRSEDEIKRLVEARKKLVETIHGNRAEGAGAGTGGEKKPNTEIKERLASAGVTLKKS